MSDPKASYRQILKSTSIVGSATVGSLVFGLIRTKILALLLGPAGIGLFGVLSVLFNTGTAVAGLNLQSTGVRQVGATAPESVERARAQTSLWLFAWLSAVLGGVIFWVFERYAYVPITPAMAGSPAFPWIAIAVGLSTLNGAQLVILQVYGRIGAIASVRLLGSLLAAIIAVVAVALLGTTGLYVAVLATPLAGVLVAYVGARKVPRLARQPMGRWLLADWRGLTVMGLGLTVAGLTGNASQLLLRSVITAGGGLSAVGLFQAAWTLSNVNLSVVLSAMAVDYFPRLTARAGSPGLMAETLNQQLHVALVLAGPILTLAIGFAPFLIRLFYSNGFADAASLLQWQIAGDVLKLAGWSLGYVLLAANSTIGFVVVGLAFDVTVVVMVWLLYPLLGLDSAGIGYIIALATTLLTSIVLVGRRGIRLHPRNLVWMTVLFGVLIGITLLSIRSASLGAVVGFGAFLVTMMIAWHEARKMDLPLPARLRSLFGRGRETK